MARGERSAEEGSVHGNQFAERAFRLRREVTKPFLWH
jgi:hypothetical protein